MEEIANALAARLAKESEELRALLGEKIKGKVPTIGRDPAESLKQVDLLDFLHLTQIVGSQFAFLASPPPSASDASYAFEFKDRAQILIDFAADFTSKRDFGENPPIGFKSTGMGWSESVGLVRQVWAIFLHRVLLWAVALRDDLMGKAFDIASLVPVTVEGAELLARIVTVQDASRPGRFVSGCRIVLGIREARLRRAAAASFMVNCAYSFPEVGKMLLSSPLDAPILLTWVATLLKSSFRSTIFSIPTKGFSRILISILRRLPQDRCALRQPAAFPLLEVLDQYLFVDSRESSRISEFSLQELQEIGRFVVEAAIYGVNGNFDPASRARAMIVLANLANRYNRDALEQSQISPDRLGLALRLVFTEDQNAYPKLLKSALRLIEQVVLNHKGGPHAASLVQFNGIITAMRLPFIAIEDDDLSSLRSSVCSLLESLPQLPQAEYKMDPRAAAMADVARDTARGETIRVRAGLALDPTLACVALHVAARTGAVHVLRALPSLQDAFAVEDALMTALKLANRAGHEKESAYLGFVLELVKMKFVTADRVLIASAEQLTAPLQARICEDFGVSATAFDAVLLATKFTLPFAFISTDIQFVAPAIDRTTLEWVLLVETSGECTHQHVHSGLRLPSRVTISGGEKWMPVVTTSPLDRALESSYDPKYFGGGAPDDWIMCNRSLTQSQFLGIVKADPGLQSVVMGPVGRSLFEDPNVHTVRGAIGEDGGAVVDVCLWSSRFRFGLTQDADIPPDLDLGDGRRAKVIVRVAPAPVFSSKKFSDRPRKRCPATTLPREFLVPGASLGWEGILFLCSAPKLCIYFYLPPKRSR